MDFFIVIFFIFIMPFVYTFIFSFILYRVFFYYFFIIRFRIVIIFFFIAITLIFFYFTFILILFLRINLFKGLEDFGLILYVVMVLLFHHYKLRVLELERWCIIYNLTNLDMDYLLSIIPWYWVIYWDK